MTGQDEVFKRLSYEVKSELVREVVSVPVSPAMRLNWITYGRSPARRFGRWLSRKEEYHVVDYVTKTHSCSLHVARSEDAPVQP